MAIILRGIGGCYIKGYWWLLYQGVLVAIILKGIGGYYIKRYWWLLY